MKTTGKQNKLYINPYKKTELRYWSHKWNITMNQMKDLLGVTGSSRVDILRDYLEKVKLLNANYKLN